MAGSILVLLLSLVLPATWIEAAYCRGLFPWVQSLVVSATGWVPLPLTLILLVLVPIIWPVLGWRRWRRGRRQGIGRATLIARGAMRVLRVLLHVAASFLLVWGIGYRRVPIEERWQLRGPGLEYEEVRDVSLRLLALIHRDAQALPAALDEGAALLAIAAGERRLVAEFEGWTPTIPANIKYAPAGAFMAMGFYGVSYPWTLEATVDPALPLPFRIAIGAHELAHVIGYCGEADANLVSFVAGLRAADPLARYSTALSMMRYALAVPSGRDAVRLRRSLPKRAQDDLAALSRAYRRYRVEFASKIQTQLNNAYLKAQGVELGVDDYERGFRLFVQAYQRGMVTLPEPFSLAEVEGRAAGGLDPPKKK